MSPAAPQPSRRDLLRWGLSAAALLGAGPLGCVSAPPKLDELELSFPAKELIHEAWRGIDPSRVVDAHVHVVGLGTGGTGCFVHPNSTSLLHPIRYAKTWFYKSAAGIYDEARADQLYVERLLDLVSHQRPRGRSLLLAFDKHHDPQGQPVLEHTEFFTPNDYVLRLVEEHGAYFLPAASIHPYREDALDELDRCAEAGAIAIKWLPNAMGIDPLDPRCVPFYERLAKHGLVLISHAGEEQAVDAEEAQELGNPLRLRPALEAGATVFVAHCASLGANRDLDAKPDASGKHPQVQSYDLFRRLMEHEVYRGRLFGEISAMTQFNRCREPLRRTLLATELHDRLINGSDYPLPAIDPVIRTGLLVDLGYLDPAERPFINELFAYDPLTFDFVLKRRLGVRREGTLRRFPAEVFMSADRFPALAARSVEEAGGG